MSKVGPTAFIFLPYVRPCNEHQFSAANDINLEIFCWKFNVQQPTQFYVIIFKVEVSFVCFRRLTLSVTVGKHVFLLTCKAL